MSFHSKFATIERGDSEFAAVVLEGELLPVRTLNEAFGTDWETDLLTLIARGRLRTLERWLGDLNGVHKRLPNDMISQEEGIYAPPYWRPRKIWGIGLNYVDHAADLSEKVPTGESASFIKPDTTIIGTGDEIVLPEQSKWVTAEAEFGVIIGKKCCDVPEEEASRWSLGSLRLWT